MGNLRSISRALHSWRLRDPEPDSAETDGQKAGSILRLLRVERPGDAIVSGPLMLIGSYRSFPCVAPCRASDGCAATQIEMIRFRRAPRVERKELACLRGLFLRLTYMLARAQIGDGIV
jgi:hypothetical protein